MKYILIIIFSIFSFQLVAKTNETKNSNWQFRFQSSFGISNYSQDKEHIIDSERQKNINFLIKLGAVDFENHKDRLKFFSKSCQNLTENEIIAVARHLSSELETIYDYSRVAGGQNTNKLVTSEDQWNGLSTKYKTNEEVSVGVCRDASRTISEFLHACGISANRLSIESYRAHAGGHQVVTILGRDGKTYTINWAELYSTKTDHRSSKPNPGILNTGIVHTSYDPITGEIIGERYTELGHILAAVTQGKVDDPNYIPHLIQLEANNKVLTANAFFSHTSRNDFLKGISISYKKNPTKWFQMTTGIAYAHNDINFQDYNDENAQASQHIIFYQFHGAIDIKEIHFLKFQNSKFYWKNNVEFDLAMAGYVTNYQNEAFPNFDITIRPQIKSAIVYEIKNLKFMTTAGVDMGVNEMKFNSSEGGYFNNGNYPNIYHRGHFLNTRIVFNKGKLQWLFSSNAYFYNAGKITRIDLKMFNRNNLNVIGLGHLRYSNNLNDQQDFAIFELKQNWNLSMLGIIGLGLNGQFSLNPIDNGTSIFFQMSYRPTKD